MYDDGYVQMQKRGTLYRSSAVSISCSLSQHI